MEAMFYNAKKIAVSADNIDGKKLETIKTKIQWRKFQII